MEVLGKLLGSQELAECLRDSGNASQSVFDALVELGEQAVTMGIDYRSLGHSWNHPMTRLQYRQACHPSTTCLASRQRAEASRQRLQEVVVAIANGSTLAESAIVETFLLEIGVHTHGPIATSASFSGVSAALAAELLLPLRALQEGQKCMHHTYSGEPLPVDALARAVQDVIAATLSKAGGFSEWRYNNPVGKEQLNGLTQDQLEKWKEPTAFVHGRGLKTHEDEAGELGFFWATKIGGPSHGFDIEGQCLLPLLANARNKVLLVSDPAWPAHPAGRAHLRLLWTAPGVAAPAEPRLWLEAVNCDFDAAAAGTADQGELTGAVLNHAVKKSEAMGVPLSVDPVLVRDLAAAVSEQSGQGGIRLSCESIALRPSNGVCEASDYLSNKHDWVQLCEEVTEPLARARYTPSSCKARRIEQLGGCP